MSSKLLTALGLWAALVQSSAAADPPSFKPTQSVVYKVAAAGPNAKGKGPSELKLHIFEPPGARPNQSRPAMVFFAGGDWKSGSVEQFYPQCDHLASRGIVAIAAEYRMGDQHGVTPAESVADGKTAMRWIRSRARQLGVNPDRIAAAGGAAGAQIAAATSDKESKFNEPREDTSVSAIPNALVLFDPFVGDAPNVGQGGEPGNRFNALNPMLAIRHGMPPTLVMIGASGDSAAADTARKFQQRMDGLGSISRLKIFENAGPEFYNSDQPESYQASLAAMDTFLESIGYLTTRR